MRSKKNQNPIIRLYLNLIEERRLLFFAFCSSIINKILDLAPPVIIGLAVDIVVNEQNSIIKLFCLQSVKEEMLKAGMEYSKDIANEACACYYEEFTKTASHQYAKTKCKLETKENLTHNRKI